jgi:hypothetical protein
VEEDVHNSSDEELHAGASKKTIELPVVPSKTAAQNNGNPASLVARKYFAILRSVKTETEDGEARGEEETTEQQPMTSTCAGRPLPMLLTSSVNLIQF